MRDTINEPSWLDFPRFLLGHRSSICRLIHAKGAIYLGAALVATAALAREYDAVSLLDHPADLLGPFAASLLLSTGLFFWFAAGLRAMQLKLAYPLRAYVVFLTGYWLTAPLAWLYAVPIEEITDEVSSMRFNLTMLSIVSIWRVLLFARVVSMQFRVGYLVSLSIILVPCMAVAFVGLISSLMDLVGVMGGVRLTQTQQVMVDYQNAVSGGIFYAFVPTVIVSLILIVVNRRDKQEILGSLESDSFAKSLWSVPVVVSIIFGVAMLFFQPALRTAARVDRLLLSDQIREGVELMSAGSPSDFPPAWDPPPLVSERYNPKPSLAVILNELEASSPEPWIVRLLLHHSNEIALRQTSVYSEFQSVGDDRPRLLYGSDEDMRDLRDTLDRILAFDELSEELRNRVQTLRDSANASLKSIRDDDEQSQPSTSEAP